MKQNEPQPCLDIYNILSVKVIHSFKKLFCNVGHICNLVQEFNGLVSKRVDRKISPFYFKKPGVLPAVFFFLSPTNKRQFF